MQNVHFLKDTAMHTHKHDLSNPFHQLGYSGEAEDIDLFIAQHRFEKGVALTDAGFWSPTQAHFLKRSLADDSDWAQAVDQRSVRLTGHEYQCIPVASKGSRSCGYSGLI
jgi:hypothetical protein